ncbi:MAG: transcription antitermination factor NusB [Rhodospirillales bacterium]|nr:transcription antitermination factor NusB [Rhodospirillales bacterium]
MPRQLAHEVLEGIFRHNERLEECFAGHPRLAGLDRRDRALARNMLGVTLRRLGQIDAIIDHFLDRPLPRKARGARQILRLGACQILFMRTPPHAAVDESVGLAAAIPALTAYKGLINAVLRRVVDKGPGLLAGQDPGRLNMAPWLWQRLEAAYGADVCKRISAAHMEAPPPLDLTVKSDAGGWAGKLGGKLLMGDTVRLSQTGPIEELAGFGDGAWWVQDGAAALPARLLGEVWGKSVIDMGAAPGGKTAQLASAGARVTAIDRSPNRLERLRENLARLKLEANVICADGCDWRPDSPADMVLLDAPCSSSGTVRRHPDMPWRKGAGEFGKLVELQKKLLDAAVQMLRPGGSVVFATCSLLPGEGPALIEQCLKSGALKRDPIRRAELGGRGEFLTTQGELRTLPSHLPDEGGMDGFFAVRLIRS